MALSRILWSALAVCASTLLTMHYLNTRALAQSANERSTTAGNAITGEGLPNPAPIVTRNWGQLPAGRKVPVPRTQLKRHQIEPDRRGPYTPKPVQARVVSRHLNGESKREIARAEGIGRDTVGRILSQQEVVETIARYQSRLLDLVPRAIGAYEEALASGDLHLAAATATKLLEGLQVLHRGGIEQTLHIANQASPESNQNQRRLLMLGQMLEGMLVKSQMYDLPLPPDLERVREELERTDAPERNLQVTRTR